MRNYDAMRDGLNALLSKYASEPPLTLAEIAGLQNEALRVAHAAFLGEFDSEGLRDNAQDFAGFAMGFAMAAYGRYKEANK